MDEGASVPLVRAEEEEAVQPAALPALCPCPKTACSHLPAHSGTEPLPFQ